MRTAVVNEGGRDRNNARRDEGKGPLSQAVITVSSTPGTGYPAATGLGPRSLAHSTLKSRPPSFLGGVTT